MRTKKGPLHGQETPLCSLSPSPRGHMNKLNRDKRACKKRKLESHFDHSSLSLSLSFTCFHSVPFFPSCRQSKSFGMGVSVHTWTFRTYGECPVCTRSAVKWLRPTFHSTHSRNADVIWFYFLSFQTLNIVIKSEHTQVSKTRLWHVTNQSFIFLQPSGRNKGWMLNQTSELT